MATTCSAALSPLSALGQEFKTLQNNALESAADLSTRIPPPIRDELRLISAANNPDGSPAWMIQDPIVNKFYRIGWLEFEILLRWSSGTVQSIVDDINASTTLRVGCEDVLELISFLQLHHLLRILLPEMVRDLTKERSLRKQSVFGWLLHHYLFFRIPIIRPQRLLAALMPFVRWLYSPVTAWLVVGITLLGLFLAARQWDTFSSTFVNQLTWAGLFSFGLALVFSKCLHELGHAMTATHYGVRVAHMGIAMLVMFPLPYTDTSESWKLVDRKQRLHIASAGIITELALAGIATLMWSLTPDGWLRSALFFLATVSWVLTLAVNLTPFMRFDGYFILSDLLDFPNLHERSAAMARTWLRRTLLGFDNDWPEDFPSYKRCMLITFASITWIYRITVFLGIAWLVYYFFFKVLGIILFLVEITWFVMLPIWRELKIWIERRQKIKFNRIIIISCLLVGLIALGIVPWQTTVHSPGWIHAEKQSVIFTPTAGKLIVVHTGGIVRQGERLFQLTSPEIANDVERAKALVEAREQEMRGLIGLENGEARRSNLQSQQEKFHAEVKLHQGELNRMDLIAPFAGKLLDMNEHLSVGSWVDPKLPLAVLIDPKSWVVDAYVQERDISRITQGNTATIYLQESHLTKLKGKVLEIDKARVPALPNILLDAQFGGAINTLPGDKHIPQDNLYRVRIQLAAPPALTRIAEVQANIETQPRAWLSDVLERITAVLVRESGF